MHPNCARIQLSSTLPDRGIAEHWRLCDVKGQIKNGPKEEAMFRTIVRLAFLTASVLALPSYAADNAQTARGEYLVTVAGCSDCHTPGYFFGKPDMERFLGGSDVGFEIPGLGVFAGRNITPDKETGIGSWTREQIVTAFQSGIRPDGRVLAPIMPWQDFAHLTKDDAMAIAAFLQ